ncbi:MAG TPA: peroxide stress protein YaaA [Intrasporangium sp.]|uniref:YaaA family protein n=1 Tax=Intrasporangium sp. TaxID=1925024 RepID=UPI002D782198|nr:peroxide stress protein YaaA [Intrasporangium sp.]HET7398686.1 peroxide stress protein YaaA [Intrasporangium sp.]
MLILLPPSEGKAQRRRGRPLDLGALSFPTLGPTRQNVIDAVGTLSTTPERYAVLGTSPSLVEEVARNTRLRTAPAAPAGEVYTGVLYDALDLMSLDAAAKRRAARAIVVVSALFGAVRLTDRIPAYRLSMSVNLPGVGPLAAAWRPALGPVLAQAAGTGLVVDCRSSTYAAAWTPARELSRRWVQVVVPGATHLAKHTRGLVARHLCSHGGAVRTPAALAAALSGSFAVELAAPTRPGRPWVLAASAIPGAQG